MVSVANGYWHITNDRTQRHGDTPIYETSRSLTLRRAYLAVPIWWSAEFGRILGRPRLVLCLTCGRFRHQLDKRGTHRFKGVGVSRVRRTAVSFKVGPLVKHAPPLHVGFTNQFFQNVLASQNVLDVARQRDAWLLERLQQQI